MIPSRARLETPSATTDKTYWLYAGHLWAVLGIALSNILLGLSFLYALFTRRTQLSPITRRRLILPLALYGLFIAVSCINSYDPTVSFEEGGKLLFSSLTLILGVLYVRGEVPVRRIVIGLLVVGGIAAAWGLGQRLAGFSGLQFRIRGPFSHYMTLAGVLLLVDSLLIAQLVSGIGRRKAWRWVLLVVINAALLIGLTRSAWIALAFAVGTLLALRSIRWLWLYLPAITLLVFVAPASVQERLASIPDLRGLSNYDRICMAEAGFRMVAERPLFGIGPHMVREMYPIYRHPSAPSEEVPHLHNTFVQIAAETGIPTLVCFLWLLAGAMWTAFRGYRREISEGGTKGDLYLGVFAALVAFATAGLFEDNWSDSEVKRVMLFAMAIPYCLLEGTPQETQQESTGASAG